MLIKQLVIVLSSCVLFSCASPGSSLEEDNYEQSARRSNCISEGSIRDYRVLDERNLLVTSGGKRRHRVLLSRPAYGIKTSWQIGFASNTSQICSGFSDIVYDQGFGAEKIRIASIASISPDEEEQLLIDFGLKEPELEQPRTPEEVQGAGVEELD